MKNEQLFLHLAQEHLNSRIETLEERKSDSLDFYEVSIWGIKRALAEAFEAGRNSK